MKSIIILFSLLISITSSFKDQEPNIDLDLLCSGKWNMAYVIMQNERMDLPSEGDQISWMIFHKDGKHEVMSFGRKFVGTWEYLKESNEIRMTDPGGSVNQKVKKLTKTELIFMYNLGGNDDIIGLKK